ncbi:MAG TPA: hypothetical protein VLF14_05105 [Candidatus Binatia bacterium]|nr:hypothetical protein [Candidatus Binatia bacterium]
MTAHFASAMKLTGIFIAVALALVFVNPARAGAAEITAANVSQHIADAKTAADHKALAAYFRAEAAEQGERVKMHEAMLASYKKSGGKPYLNMVDHCKALLAESRGLQKDYEKMAELHEELAKGAGS